MFLARYAPSDLGIAYGAYAVCLLGQTSVATDVDLTRAIFFNLIYVAPLSTKRVCMA